MANVKALVGNTFSKERILHVAEMGVGLGIGLAAPAYVRMIPGVATLPPVATDLGLIVVEMLAATAAAGHSMGVARTLEAAAGGTLIHLVASLVPQVKPQLGLAMYR